MTEDDRAIRNIVVAVGPRFWDDPVLPAAFELAKRCGAHLHAVRAFDPPGRGAAPGDPVDPKEAIERRQAEMLAGLCGQVETLGTGPEVGCHVLVGPPDEVVRELVERHGADLVAVGAARMEHLELRLLGTKAERIIAGSKVPVLVLRRPVEHPVRNVLVAVDPSPESAHVFDEGRAVVSALFDGGSQAYRALRVIWEAMPGADQTADPSAAVTTGLEAFLKERDSPDAEPRVRAGMPAGVILAEAREWPADLVVLGTSARTGAERMLMGSVCASVLRDLPGNALVIPTGKAAAQG